jgi:hypothetical protein
MYADIYLPVNVQSWVSISADSESHKVVTVRSYNYKINVVIGFSSTEIGN